MATCQCLGNQAQMLGLLWTLMPIPPIEMDLISCYSHQLNCCPPLQWSNLNLQLTELLPHLMLLSPRPIQFPWSGNEVSNFQTSDRFFSLCPWPLWRREGGSRHFCSLLTLSWMEKQPMQLIFESVWLGKKNDDIVLLHKWIMKPRVI